MPKITRPKPVQDATRTPPGRAYTGPGITVYYDKKRCIHFKACVRGLPAVFDTERKPWIKPDEASLAKLVEVVRRCPTGALHYVLDKGPPEPPDAPSVEPRTNGPLFVRGDLTLVTPRGVLRDTRAALCRCGASQNKPFCDDSHDECEFKAAGSRKVNPY